MGKVEIDEEKFDQPVDQQVDEILEENTELIDIDSKPEKTKKKSGKLVNIISNIVFIPVMVILIIYLVYAISVQKSNGVPSFFGQSYVRVLSGSMRKSGFEKGDVVVIERTKISNIKAADQFEKNGSIIAFYDSSIKRNNDVSKSKLLTEKPSNTLDFETGKKTYQTIIKFHQVIGIYYDTSGNTWFETKGTSSSSADTYLVRGDYVIGVYTDSFMADVIQFISSPQGMIVLIIVPASVLLFLLLLNIIEIADQMMREKREKEALLGGGVKERELEVTTIIEDNTEEATRKRRKRRAERVSDDSDDISLEE